MQQQQHWDVHRTAYELTIAGVPVLAVKEAVEPNIDHDIWVTQHTHVVVACDGAYAYVSQVLPDGRVRLGEPADGVQQLVTKLLRALERE
jgi:hypothetical protein